MREVQVPDIRIEHMQIECVGVTPLLVNRLTEEAQVNISAGSGRGAKGPTKKSTPDESFHASRYRIDGDTDGLPAGAFHKAVILASSRFVDAKSGPTVAGAVIISGELLPIEGSKPILHTVTGKLQGKTPIPIHRAMYDPWRVIVPVTHLADVISEAQVLNLFRLAGAAVGVGAWRPEKKGTFGQFQVKNVIAS